MTRWTAVHMEIVERLAGKWHDREIALWILGETGDAFSARTVRRYREAAQLPGCHRNDHLKRRRPSTQGPMHCGH